MSIAQFAGITYSFNGGYSQYEAFQATFDWRLRADPSLLSSLTLSRPIDNGSGSLENRHDQLRLAAPDRKGRWLLGGVSPVVDLSSGGGSWRASTR